MKWDLEENVPDMTGKNIIITGCTSGIGLESASQLLQRNATIVMACRNQEKMATVAKSFQERHGITDSTRIIQLILDVSDLNSVRAFPEALRSSGITSLHAIVLNAGTAERGYKSSAQNIELTFATNILGQWLLSALLLPFIQQVESSRIVAISSQTHFMQNTIDYNLIRAVIDDDTTDYKARYAGRVMYMQTKLATHWLIAELNQRLQKANAKTVAVVAHPGYSMTAMTTPSSNINTGWFSEQLIHLLASPFRQTGEQGAWSLTFAASDIAISPFFHYGPGQMFGTWGSPVRDSPVSGNANDRYEQKRLWDQCENMCDETFPI